MAEVGVTSIDRALLIIEAFRNGDDHLNLQDIASQTKLNKATIIRLIASLERFGYVLRISQGTYALGPAFLTFANLYQASFRLSDQTYPVLRSLVRETGQSAAFFIRDGDTRICLHKLDSNTGDLVSRLREGDCRPILPGGTGRIMMAFSEDPAEREAFHDESESYLAINLGERSSEVCSVVAPVFKNSQLLAGVLSLSGPNANFTPDLIDGYRVHVLRAAAGLTRRLGGDASPFEPLLHAAGD